MIVGAGHAGLAMSRCLTQRVDRPRRARARRGRQLLARRALARAAPADARTGSRGCPASTYDGDDPDGYQAVPEVADLINRYASIVDAPVHPNTTVCAIRVDRTTATRCSPTRARGRPTRSSWRAAPPIARPFRSWPPPCPAGSPRSARIDYRGPDAARRGRCPGRRGVGHRCATRRRDPARRAAR